VLGDLEEHRFGGAQRPQRATVARGQPAGLTDVHRALVKDSVVQLGVRASERVRDAQIASTAPVDTLTPNRSRASSIIPRREIRLRVLAGLEDSERVHSFTRLRERARGTFPDRGRHSGRHGSSETLGKQQGSDERLGKRTYVTEFGLDGARELAAQSHARARAVALAARDTGAELEQITDFIATRSF
jgi:geranylgeranyl diphosphate synthase, type II